mmetsp:Transcript_30441/g.61967  ORF Transcript_30441/g.61967 Transcript_30441/m.61967 type:complete len:242 (-) Transcript_30441:202-927(-)
MADQYVQSQGNEGNGEASYAEYGFSSMEEFQAAAQQQQQLMMMMMGGGYGIDEQTQAQMYAQMMPYMQQAGAVGVEGYGGMPEESAIANAAAAMVAHQPSSDEQPTYVNAKQYKRIIKRRQARALLEKRKSIPTSRKNYLHESRHQHAMRRPRGPGGRFLTKGELEAYRELEAGGMSEKDAVAQACAESDAAKAAVKAAEAASPNSSLLNGDTYIPKPADGAGSVNTAPPPSAEANGTHDV